MAAAVVFRSARRGGELPTAPDGVQRGKRIDAAV
jgi:hypothetical protein